MSYANNTHTIRQRVNEQRIYMVGRLPWGHSTAALSSAPQVIHILRMYGHEQLLIW